jgi:transcriptional regulator GlxA family with amidase domain
VRDYVEQNIAETIPIARLAMITGLSTSHFCRVFKVSVGQTPHQYIMRRRIHHAQAMILDGEALCQVAVACGLSDQAHLSRIFKRFTGQTPKTWGRTFRAA